MKIVSMVCPNCGASLQVDADQKNNGKAFVLDAAVKGVQKYEPQTDI